MEAEPERSSPRSAPDPVSPVREADRPRAGAVLLRRKGAHPEASRAAWPVVAPAQPGRRPASPNVGTEKAVGAPLRQPRPFNVGTSGAFRRTDAAASASREREADGIDLPPSGHYVESAIPTKLKGPEVYKPQGRAGPDLELARVLREARKQQVLDRARARGRDPGAGAEEVVRGTTRSAKTQEQYLARGNQLLARYRRECGILSDDLLSLDALEFADWVLSLKPMLKPTAWRPYKQAAKAILATLPDTDEAITVIDADTAEPGSEPERKSAKKPSATKRNLPRRTSALKAKYIAKRDFETLVKYLRRLSSSKYASILADWLVAGLATGLRPVEWMATAVEISENPAAASGRNVWLYVLNAKHTNNRANGAVRTIDLSATRDEAVGAVQRMSELGRDWLVRGVFEEMQSQCSQLMYNTSDRLFPGRKYTYALSSTRHQFIANAKSYHKPEAVSAMVGHAVTDTAVENYGKRRNAWAPEDLVDRADPVPDEVATVKRRHVFYEDRIRMLRDAGLVPPGIASEE